VFYVLQVELSKQKILNFKKKIKHLDSIFAEKRYLETVGPPLFIIGREKEAEQVVKLLYPSKDGFSFPFVSVIGKSGTGKSNVVKRVCENLSNQASYCFVNLRKTDTHFGCTNLILENLDSQSVKSSAGINAAIDAIENRIIEMLLRDKKSNFILVLDEFDVIFTDKRRRGSDFVYMLLTLSNSLRTKGFWLCIVAISNTRIDDYPLDERVKSRLDDCQVYFPPYTAKEIYHILKEISTKAFVNTVNDEVLRECAYLSSADSGDCRRALQLLRYAAEIAKGKITVDDVNKAVAKTQEQYLEMIIETATGHQKILLQSMARLTLKNGEEIHSTQEIFEEYESIQIFDSKHLGYRRVFDLLEELENLGVIVSKKTSQGRFGYHKLHRLLIHYDIVGNAVSDGDWFEQVDDILRSKNLMEKHLEKVREKLKIKKMMEKNY